MEWVGTARGSGRGGNMEGGARVRKPGAGPSGRTGTPSGAGHSLVGVARIRYDKGLGLKDWTLWSHFGRGQVRSMAR